MSCDGCGTNGTTGLAPGQMPMTTVDPGGVSAQFAASPLGQALDGNRWRQRRHLWRIVTILVVGLALGYFIWGGE